MIDVRVGYLYNGVEFTYTSFVMEDKATIKIPRPLYNKLHTIVDQTGFDSVTDFVVYCMRDIVTSKEKGDIKERLRQLGYDV
ncbi:MAG: hypothetical protein ACD_41C00287G0010 [uncultured bacterium]|nr:MAG: hypothetical protein ACD_41C00287G0010 [uncultured bacterium]